MATQPSPWLGLASGILGAGGERKSGKDPEPNSDPIPPRLRAIYPRI